MTEVTKLKWTIRENLNLDEVESKIEEVENLLLSESDINKTQEYLNELIYLNNRKLMLTFRG